jgi:hypothetical protein
MPIRPIAMPITCRGPYERFFNFSCRISKIDTGSTKFRWGLIPDLAVSSSVDAIVLLALLRLVEQQWPFCREIAQ